MNFVTRLAAVAVSGAALALPISAHADSPNAGGTATHSAGSQLVAHFMTIDATGCLRNDLFIHGVAETPGAIDADVESFNQCTGSLLLLTGGTSYSSTVQVDEALQSGQASGTIVTYDRLTRNPLAVTIDLAWAGYGGLTTTPLAPGQSATGAGFHVTTPYANVTYNGVASFRSATVVGSIDVAGYSFPMSSLQPDLTDLSAGSTNFIVAVKP